jgi:chromate reductase, NAD(P)H dehydrogenase (quinone)
MKTPGSEPKLNVLVFAASLRGDSLNRQLASLAARVAQREGAQVDVAAMQDFDVPSYDGDVEKAGGIPKGAEELRRRLAACDAFIIASPEYNASMPGVLKNLIDWTSRFRPQPFDGKQGLLMSASPSMVGGNRGLWAVRVPLEHLGARIYPDMFSLAQAHKALAGGEIAGALRAEPASVSVAGRGGQALPLHQARLGRVPGRDAGHGGRPCGPGRLVTLPHRTAAATRFAAAGSSIWS